MKAFTSLLSAATLVAQASAHYTWPNLLVGSTNTSNWQYVRKTNNWQDLNPLTDVTGTDIRCYNSKGSATASTYTVAAGSTIGFDVSGNPSNLYHAGVLNVYMAKAPSGTDVANWDGSGNVWFKVYQISAVTDGGSTITFPTTGMTKINFQIPSQLPSGQYLVRTEHIAIHSASSYGGAQFYIGCAQVQVTGGGSGTPGPLVSFPGAYTGYEPGILIDIYYPIPATYTQPGPAVWPAGSGGSGSSPSGPTTTAKTTTAAQTTTAAGTTTSSSAGGAAAYAQCGGQGWNGATTCVSGYTCTASNSYYSQCLPK